MSKKSVLIVLLLVFGLKTAHAAAFNQVILDFNKFIDKSDTNIAKPIEKSNPFKQQSTSSIKTSTSQECECICEENTKLSAKTPNTTKQTNAKKTNAKPTTQKTANTTSQQRQTKPKAKENVNSNKSENIKTNRKASQKLENTPKTEQNLTNTQNINIQLESEMSIETPKPQQQNTKKGSVNKKNIPLLNCYAAYLTSNQYYKYIHLVECRTRN